MNNYPIYRGSISEDDNEIEVSFIALVNNPAIKSNFLAFNEHKLSYAITNEEERIITGLAMVADMPLFRDVDGKKYYVYYDAPSIKTMAQKFFRRKYNFNLNLNHNPNYKVEDVYVFESWIVDRSKGKQSMQQFSDVADGSWIISAKVDNLEVWEAIKRGEFKGFSIEGIFKLEKIEASEMTEDEFVKEFVNLIQEAKF